MTEGNQIILPMSSKESQTFFCIIFSLKLYLKKIEQNVSNKIFVRFNQFFTGFYKCKPE